MRPGREVRARLEDVVRALDAIAAHLARGPLADPLVFDAVRMRLVEIGEAIGAVPHYVLRTEPSIPWKEVVAMRHKLAHHYLDTAVGIVEATVEDDVPVLAAAVGRLLAASDDERP